MDIVNDGSTLVLAGDFDVRSTMEVRNALRQHLETADHDIVVDLTDVPAIDLTALKVLAFATRRATLQGRRLTLRGAGPAVRRMLLLSHLIRVVELERTGATA